MGHNYGAEDGSARDIPVFSQKITACINALQINYYGTCPVPETMARIKLYG